MESKGLEIATHIENVGQLLGQAVCRLCSSSQERLIAIYSEEGITNGLSTKINLYLPVKVSLGDDLPLQCCLNCASTLLAWHELVLTTVESDKKFRSSELIDEKEIDRGGPFKTVTVVNVLPTPEEESIGIDPLELPSLNNFCQTEDPSSPPKKAKHPKRKQKPEEPFYPDTSSSLETYMSDMGHFMVDKELCDDFTEATKEESEAIKVEDEYGYLACQHCQAIFVSKQAIENHFEADHPGKQYLVSAISEHKSSLERITKERRKNTKIDQQVINEAKVVVDGRIYYNCKECGKSLHSPYTYVWHMRIHTGERPFVCDLCGKQFRVSQGLVRHLRETHEGIKKFPCDLCGRMFATRRNVEEHRRIHTNERPYVCDLCGKSFKQKASLYVHKRSHRDFFPFKCSYCNQGFRTKPPLMIHVTRHTGEKPYKCEVCGRCFRIKYELKRHKLIHSDEKPFSCDLCGLSFRQKRYLRNHAKSNHSVAT